MKTILSYVSSAKLREYAMEGLTNLGPFAEAKAVALRKCGSVRRIPIVQVQKHDAQVLATAQIQPLQPQTFLIDVAY